MRYSGGPVGLRLYTCVMRNKERDQFSVAHDFTCPLSCERRYDPVVCTPRG